MRTIVFSFVIVLSVISLSDSEKTLGKIRGSGEALDGSIKYNVITDRITGPNKFEIAYEVTYGEFIFKRFEKCRISEGNQTEPNSNELYCSGTTKFTRSGDVENVTNFDEYTYSSNGFNHTGETFKVSDNYYRVNAINLVYGLQADAISLKKNVTQAVEKLQFDRVGENSLNVSLTINSTYFAMNRTELFSTGVDEETETNELSCVGLVTVVVRNSDDYHTIQREAFTLGEDYSFAYVSEAEFLNVNGTSADNSYNGTTDQLTY